MTPTPTPCKKKLNKNPTTENAANGKTSSASQGPICGYVSRYLGNHTALFTPAPSLQLFHIH